MIAHHAADPTLIDWATSVALFATAIAVSVAAVWRTRKRP